ncbi:MAG: hypothetical protein HC892_18270 [Saprospiraceae bacterium]|nr:hypothetical protein [Saprospiraceae bacterium]
MVTDVTPTLLEMAGVNLTTIQSAVPFTGKSLHPYSVAKPTVFMHQMNPLV